MGEEAEITMPGFISDILRTLLDLFGIDIFGSLG